MISAGVYVYRQRYELGARFAPSWLLWKFQHDEPGDWAHFVLIDRVYARIAVERPRIDAQKVRIESELATLGGHPWAGRYKWEEGDGAESLVIAPQSGFVYWRGGPPPGIRQQSNYGDVVEDSSGWLHLRPAIGTDVLGHWGMETEYCAVRWGDRRLLVPHEGMIGFCYGVNEGWHHQMRDGPVLLACLTRVEDLAKPIYGLPSVPDEFRPYLLSEPVIGQITSIDEFERRADESADAGSESDGEQDGPRDGAYYRWAVTVNVGRAEHLLPGMWLFNSDGDSLGVVSVGEHTCRAELESEPIARSRVPKLAVGMPLSTQAR